MRTLLACLLVVAASGCPDIKTDPGEGSGLPTIDGPTVEFDPANSILPFPNNLVLCQTGTDSTGAPCTVGKIAIPPPACESDGQKAIRTGVLNQLDGFGTWEAAMQVTFTEPVDAATLDGNIVMYQRTKGATSIDPSAATKVPVLLKASQTLRFTASTCTSPATVAAVTVVPLVPLDQKSTYIVAVLQGVKTATGKDYLPSFTWALARQKDDPVTLDSQGNIVADRTPLDPVADAAKLKGLDLLWKAHAQGMGFLAAVLGLTDDARAKVLLAWEITTQTTTDQLDPNVAGSPSNKLATSVFLGLQSITCDSAINAATCPRGYDRAAQPFVQCNVADNGTQCFLKIALGVAAGASGLAIYPTGNAICGQVHCADVSDVLGAVIPTSNYQQPLTNPIGGPPIPGPWSDPVNPVLQSSPLVEVLVFVPTATALGPTPTLIFGHGLTSSKKALFAFAPQLSHAGFASVAIDFVDHGTRAVQISTAAALGCNGTPPLDPSALPQCFAPILSSDLAQSRDNIRQTVLDLQRLTLATKACGAAGCTSSNVGGAGAVSVLKVDAAHMVYAGQSLGGIIGTVVTATAPDIKASVLDVASIAWIDILEHTDNLGIRCQLVDALIDAGVLMGDKWNGSSTSPTGLCSTEDWQMQPGYAQFSQVARWVIDPADGANYMAKLATKKWFLQEVVNDEVVPNYSTDEEGTLGGLTAGTADIFVPVCAGGANAGQACADDTACPASKCLADPSAGALVNTPVWLRYPTLPANGATGFPGNTFKHASLLRPANGNADGQLGTARMQTDAITYLFLNK